MRFRNSIQLFVENFKNVYRVLFYKLIIFIIACALCSAFILPEIQGIMNSEPMLALIDDIKDFIKAITSLNSDLLAATRESLVSENGTVRQALLYLTDMTSEIVWTCVIYLLIFLLQYYIGTLCDFTIGSILKDKMTTYSETPFFTAFVSNLGKANRYALVFLPVSLLFWIITIAVAYICFVIFPILTALFLTMTVIVLFQSLKMTVVGRWMPAKTEGEKMLEGIKRVGQLEKRQRLKEFSCYLVTVYAIIILNLVAGVCTFGSALLITMPAAYVLLICMQYVNYYTAKGKKYFVTYEQIENNTHFGDTEHIFEYVEQEEQKIEENKE